MAKPWGSVGSWAADSELAEHDLNLQQQQQQQQTPHHSLDDAAFPSLGQSASTKPRKKKQQQTFSLAEFTAANDVGRTPSFLSSDFKGLTVDEKLVLPTGPRDRSGEEDSSGRLGGGFKDYGAYRGGRSGGDRDKEGGFGDGYGRKERAEEPSRADDSDDWGALKRSAPPSRGAYEDDRRRGGKISDRDLPSKADGDDNWASSKKGSLPPSTGRSSGRYEDQRGGSGRYEDPRGGDFSESHHSSRADDVDNWGAAKKSAPSLPNVRRVGSFDSSEGDKEPLSDPNRSGRMERERPRLVLQPRTRPVDLSSSPSGSESENTRPSNGSEHDPVSPNKSILFGNTHSEQVPAPKVQNMEGVAAKPSKLNPFGDAKPREILLEQKGMDWRKFDADLERNSLQRPETNEEKQLKDEIKTLQEMIKSGDAKFGTKYTGVVHEQNNCLNATEELAKKARDLEQLTCSLNDKVRFAQGGHGPRVGNGKTQDIWTRSVSGEREKRGGRW